MICSNNLGTLPLLSNFDSTRSFMAGKQIIQAIPSAKCNIPHLLSPDYLKYSSELNILRAKHDGVVKYTDEDIMVIEYHNNDDIEVQILSIPKYKKTSDDLCIQLKMFLEKGTEFKETDIIFEYTGFDKGLITLGYNLDTAFMGYFGLTFSDSIVISESTSKLMTTEKLISTLIPIYSDSNFDFTKYPNSKYKFIPEEGQTLTDNILYTEYDALGEVLNRTYLPYSNGITHRVRFHKILNTATKHKSHSDLIEYLRALTTPLKIITKELNTLDNKNLRDVVSLLFCDMANFILTSFNKMSDGLENSNLAYELLWTYKTNIKQSAKKTSNKKILFFIEIDTLFKDIPVKIGDKITNSYANKGTISKIVDDDLMPYNPKTGRRVDVIVGALSVYSRMIFSQIINISFSKCIRYVEESIIENNDNLIPELRKLQVIINYVNSNNKPYVEKVEALICSLEDPNNDQLREQFINDIETRNLYTLYPAFSNIDFEKLLRLIEVTFNISVYDDLVIPREAFIKYGNYLQPPKKDMVAKNIFCGPNHIQRLKQLADSKTTSRSTGKYTSDDQPTKDGVNINESGGDASKIGTMEFDALIAHGADDVIFEIKLIKSSGVVSNKMIHSYIDSIDGKVPDEDVKNLASNTLVKTKISSLLSFLDNGENLKSTDFKS